MIADNQVTNGSITSLSKDDSKLLEKLMVDMRIYLSMPKWKRILYKFIMKGIK